MKLTDSVFTDADKARRYMARERWPHGPVCPHCGNVDQNKITALEGKAHRAGVYQCNEPECREQFTVTVGTVMERSKIPLNKWLLATYLMNAGKKGTSAHQIHRTIGVTYKTAWFMCHRIRLMMDDSASDRGPLGGEGKIVEADETYFGDVPESKRKTKTSRGHPFTKKGKRANKQAIVALVERGGSVRSFHVAVADGASVAKIVNENVARESRLQTDESRLYIKVGTQYAAHETINHSANEYARGDVTTNSVEGVFSIFKRGMKGVYQHCAEKHLHRYLAEFDFRYNHRSALGFSDGERAALAIRNSGGKRLTYRPTNRA
jgi:transposase-like protein